MRNINCPFCNIDPDRILFCNDNVLAILDGFPVTEGHTLIIPRRHTPNYFDLSSEEKAALWDAVDKCKGILDQRFHPNGYNIGVNIGAVAGQTIPHVHIHLIPRRDGDTENPKGGVRGVIPDKQSY